MKEYMLDVGRRSVPGQTHNRARIFFCNLYLNHFSYHRQRLLACSCCSKQHQPYIPVCSLRVGVRKACLAGTGRPYRRILFGSHSIQGFCRKVRDKVQFDQSWRGGANEVDAITFVGCETGSCVSGDGDVLSRHSILGSGGISKGCVGRGWYEKVEEEEACERRG